MFIRYVGIRYYSSMLRREAYVGGQWVQAKSGKMFPVTNPANGKVIGEVPDMDVKDTEVAIERAYEAFQSWQWMTAKDRSTVLRRWYSLVEIHNEELAELLTAEAGKPLTESRGEVSYGSSFIEWFAEEGKRIDGDVIQSPHPNKEMIFVRQPIGVATMITPWNFPNAMITRKAAAAIASGCTCVLKPAEDTPLSALALAHLADKAGVPPGVFNVITSSRENTPAVGKLLCTHPKVAGVSFTGSTAVGRLLYEQCAHGIKRISLELGGNAAFIVFDSADVTAAIEGLMVAKFRNSGQTCVSANRILVQSGIYDKFVTTLEETMKKRLVVGDGSKKNVNIGPLINQSQFNRVERMVNETVYQGAKLVLGGKGHSCGNLFYEPTILTGVKENMAVMQDEVFGPVISLQKFETEDEAIKMANATDRGLANYFFTRDVGQAWRVARRLECGMVGVNEGLISSAETCFGGIKQSGIGREGSKHGTEDYTYIKYICFGGIAR